MKYLYVLILLFFTEALPCMAQDKPSITPYLALDSRNSFLKENPVGFWGIQGGVGIGRTSFGVGYYFLGSKIYRKISPGVQQRLFFNYWTVWGSYIFLEKERYYITGVFQLGAGDAYYKEGSAVVDKESIILVEPSVYATYRITDWLGLIGGVGVRKTIIPDILKTNNFSGGIGTIGFTIFPAALFNLIFSPKGNDDVVETFSNF